MLLPAGQVGLQTAAYVKCSITEWPPREKIPSVFYQQAHDSQILQSHSSFLSWNLEREINAGKKEYICYNDVNMCCLLLQAVPSASELSAGHSVSLQPAVPHCSQQKIVLGKSIPFTSAAFPASREFSRQLLRKLRHCAWAVAL